MKKHEKLRKCIKNLIKQNVDDLVNYDVSRMFSDDILSNANGQSVVDVMSYFNGGDNAEGSTHDDLSSHEVSLEDLFLKVTSNWNIRSRGRKKDTKRGRPKVNKIVMKL